MFGVGLLCLDDNLSISLGDFLTLIAGICYAFHFFYIDKYSKHDTILLLILQFFVIALLSSIIAPLYHSDFDFYLELLLDKNIILSLSFLVVFCSLVGFFLQMICQKYVSPTIVGIVLSLESVFGIFVSIFFLDEEITQKVFIGCCLIFVSIVLVNINFGKKDAKTTKSKRKDNLPNKKPKNMRSKKARFATNKISRDVVNKIARDVINKIAMDIIDEKARNVARKKNIKKKRKI